MADFALGMNAKIFQGTAGDPAPSDVTSLTEMTNVKNVSLSLEAGEANTTTRANNGWESTTPTLKKATCEWEMQFKPGDTQIAAIRSAYLSNSPVALGVLTGDPAVTGSEGPVGNWSITGFSRDEELEEAIVYKVTAKLQEFGD